MGGIHVTSQMGGIHVTSQSFPLDSNDFARAALRLFVNFDNNGLLSTVNLSPDIYPTLHVFKNGNRKISQSGQFIYEKIQTVTFPDTQQLRFHCCTELAEKGVPLEYIQRFMSHLTSSMVRYHILPKSSPQEDMEFSLKTLQEVVSGKTKILGDNKGLSDNINEFINANHFNVATDLDEICKALANKIPIRQKTGGVCIKSSQLRECSMDAKTMNFTALMEFVQISSIFTIMPILHIDNVKNYRKQSISIKSVVICVKLKKRPICCITSQKHDFFQNWKI